MLVRSIGMIGTIFSISVVIIYAEETNADGTEIILDLDKIQQLGNADVMLRTISKLTLALNNCGVDVRGMKELRRIMLPSTSYSRCMDGSNAGYYIRKKTGSSRWLVYLEGGMYCFDKKSCRSRSMNTPNFTSSANWPLTREGSGILSWNPEENPLMYSANIVLIPYCSSDAWSGNNTKNGMYFHGSTIIEEVITDLVERQGLGESEIDRDEGETPRETKLFLAGSSAGATGVLLNIDRVSDLLSHSSSEESSINVYGIVDSGWFIDTEQFIKGSCTNTLNCSPAQSVTKGFRLWKPQMPKRCRRAYSEEPWRCFFGYRVYPYIHSPLFVITYLYDRAQILASMGGGLSTYQDVQNDMYSQPNTNRKVYLRDLAKFINATLTNVSAVFAPSCMDHELLERSMWHSVSIDGTSLVEALRCWELSQQTSTFSTRTDEELDVDMEEVDFISGIVRELAELSSTPENRVRHPGGPDTRDNRISKNRRRNRKRKQRKRLKNRIRHRLRSKRDIDDQALIDAAIQNKLLKSFNQDSVRQCKMRLFDHCDTPNCNLRCPNYLSLFTSNEKKSKTSLTNSYSPDISEITNTVHDKTILSEILSRQT